MKVCSLLSLWGLYHNFRDSDIQQEDLAALSDDDLQQFGITSDAVRREMLSQFSNSPNQLLHYDKFVFIMIILPVFDVFHPNMNKSEM